MRQSRDRWLVNKFLIQKISNTMAVLREDILEGGTKLRFLPYLTAGAKEIVYASPFCGGAQVALAVMGNFTKQRITIFSAQRKEPHDMQLRALRWGAMSIAVPYGYLSNVTAKAKAYAAAQGALYLPLGFDVPEAHAAYGRFVARVAKQVGGVDEIWVAAGSGMVARAFAAGFPDTRITGVSVGRALSSLESADQPANLRSNLRFIEYGTPFASPCKIIPPFPSCPNYDAKAWHLCTQAAKTHPKKRMLFINVLG